MTNGARFDAMWMPEPNSGCHLWLGALQRGGYGAFGVNRKAKRAHRVSWERAHGPISAGAHVLHRCDTPACVNPDHLFLGDQRSNMADMAAKGRASDWRRGIQACPHGHGYDQANTLISRDGRRACRTCALLSKRAARLRKKATA